MTWDELLAYCLAKPGAWEDRPWDDQVVAKVADKVFAFTGNGDRKPVAVGLRGGLSREEADEWLARYPADAEVMHHMGKYGWNTLRAGGEISDAELLEAVDISYDLVVSKLPKSKRPVV